MTLEFKIDIEAGIIFTKAEGSVSEQEIQATQELILSDPDYRPSMANLVDMTAASVIFGASGAFRLAKWAGIHKPFRKLALVASNDSYPFLGMYESIVGVDWQDVKVFEDMNSARLWLGLPAEE